MRFAVSVGSIGKERILNLQEGVFFGSGLALRLLRVDWHSLLYRLRGPYWRLR